MYYLEFGVDFDSKNEVLIYLSEPRLAANVYRYPASEDLHNLQRQWKKTHGVVDGQISGILADYIEDNLPVDIPLSYFIYWLRERFNSPDNNISIEDD